MKNCVSCNKELSDQTHAMYHGYCLDCGSSKKSKISYNPDGTRIRKHVEILPADSHSGPPTRQIIVEGEKSNSDDKPFIFYSKLQGEFIKSNENERMCPVEQIKREVDKDITNILRKESAIKALLCKPNNKMIWYEADQNTKFAVKIGDGNDVYVTKAEIMDYLERNGWPKETRVSSIKSRNVGDLKTMPSITLALTEKISQPIKGIQVLPDGCSPTFSVQKNRAEVYQTFFESLIYKSFSKETTTVTSCTAEAASKVLNNCDYKHQSVKLSCVKTEYIDFTLSLYKDKATLSIYSKIPITLVNAYLGLNYIDKIAAEINKASCIKNEFYSFNSKIEERMKDRNYIFEISDIFASFHL